MQQPENQFIQSINRKYLKPVQLHFEKMHNPFRSGTFDVWYSGSLDDLWVEYKYSRVLQSFIVKDLMSELQFHWGMTRHLEGRNVAAIVGFPQGGIVLPPKSWARKIPITRIERDLLKRKQLADWILKYTTGKSLCG